jgi:hypothetical protein
MKFGRPLYIDLRKGAPSLQTDYMIDDKFPLEVWDATDHEKVRALCAPCSVLSVSFANTCATQASVCTNSNFAVCVSDLM